MAFNKFMVAKSSVQTMWARLVCAVLLSLTGAHASAQGEFTDRVSNAKTIDTKGLRDGAKSGADNLGFIIGIGATVIGLAFFFWGVLWVMSASRSEGRKQATPGWVMMLGGGALGAGTALYLLFVGVFSGAAG